MSPANQICVVGLVAVIACGGDDDESASSSTMADATALTLSSDGGSSTGASGTDETMDPTAMDSTSGSGDPTTAGSTGSGDPGACVPSMASFMIEPPALAQASITFDFAAMSCAAVSLTGEAPQIVLDVQPTGTVNATAFGIEITDSSHGLLFDSPPVGDSQVQDLMPDIEFTMQATAVDGTTPMTIVFTIFSQGPTLIDVSVAYG
ncbi:MAG TPA: hypothetical protein VFG69_13905 [Nannocystaceae bacterium]|nr:hypothetical protein [Nannocystaceae bacterium]